MYVCVSEEAKKMGLTANNDDGSGTKLTDMITQLNQFSNVLLYCMQIYAKKGADKKYKQDFELFYRLREPYGDFFHDGNCWYCQHPFLV